MKRSAVSLVFVISEIAASFGVWHGTRVLAPRLLDSTRGWSMPNPVGNLVFLPGTRRYSILLPLALASLLSIEWITSVVYWHALNIEQAGFLGWASEFYHVRDHLICWAISLLINTGVWLFWRHRKSSERAIRVH